ncbi:MAG: putative collagen-binding domain-containing protein [Planctomycetota bacterium]
MKIIALTVIVCVMAIVNIASADTFGMGTKQFTINFVTISGDASSDNGTNIGQYSSGDSKYETFTDPGDYRSLLMNNYSKAPSGKATLTVAECGDIGISLSGHYVTYRGDTLLLIGDSGTQCAAQNGNLNCREWIDDCNDRGIRSVHLWSFVPVRQKQDGSQIEDRWGYVIPDVMPWARKTAGPLAHDQRYQWDLRVFDEGTDADMTHYWPRMRDMCSYAKSKDMLVGITMFTGWSKHDYSWVFHPLNINNGGHLAGKEDTVIIASPGTEVWQETWSDHWSNSKKTQWVWEQLSIKAINELGSIGNVFFVFFDEHSYSEGNMGDHFRDFFRKRGQIWVDWEARRSTVNWVMSNTSGRDDKNSNAVSAFNGSPVRPYFFLEGEPYQGSGVRTAIWTFSMGGANYFFHADAGQETVRTGIMGYDPYVPGGDKGMYKRDWLGHASRFFNEHADYLDSMVPHNDLTTAGTYCLAAPNREYVLYSTVGSPAAFSLDLSAAAGKTVNCRFYDPREGHFEPVFQRVASSSSETFTKPTLDDWILHVIRE